MANEASFVPLGRDNTGAATVLQPFNSQGIWNAYDKSQAMPKTPLLDSFGKPLNYQGSKIHPKDVPVIKEKMMNFLNTKTRMMMEAKASKRDITPQEQQALLELQQDAMDAVSLAQQQYADAIKQQDAIRRNPFGYPEGASSKIDQYFEQPPDKRPVFFGVQEIPSGNYVGWLEGIGNPTKKYDKDIILSDGSSAKKGGTYFDENAAKDAFKTSVLPQLFSTANGRGLIASLENDIRKAAAAQNQDYDALSNDQKAALIIPVAEDFYINTKRNQYQYSSRNATKDATDKQRSGGGQRNITKDTLPVIASRAYIVHDKEGNRVPGATSSVPGESRLELIDVLEMPVAGRFGSESGPSEEKPLYFITKNGSQVLANIVTIRQYKPSGKKDFDSEMWATIVDKDGAQDEVPLTGQNLQTFKKEFKIDPKEYRDKFYPNWRNHFQNIPKTNLENMPYWNTYSEGEKAAYRAAYERRYGKSSAETPAPVKPTESKSSAKERWIKEYGSQK